MSSDSTLQIYQNNGYCNSLLQQEDQYIAYCVNSFYGKLILCNALWLVQIKFCLQNCNNLLASSNERKRRRVRQREIRELALTTHDILYSTLILLQQLHITMVVSIRTCSAPLFSEIHADSARTRCISEREKCRANRAPVLNKKFHINTDEDTRSGDKGTRCESCIRRH